MTEFLNKELFSCSNCNSTNDTNFEGFVVCTDCGTTKTKDYVDYRSSISETENTLQNSIGKSIDFVGSLGSQIGYSSGLLRGTRGSKLSNQVISKYQRLIKFHHNRSRIDGNATHLRTMISFNRVFNSFNLSKDIKNRTLYIYWKHVKSGKKFTNHILLVALCFLQIIREEGEKTPIKFSEVIKRFADFGHRVTNKNILRLAHELDVPLSSQFRKPEDYITRITSQIRLNTEINNKLSKLSLSNDEYVTLLALISNKFLKYIHRKERGGVQPFPFAVSIVYLADRVICKFYCCKSILTQKTLANIVNSAEFTIRDHVYRFLGDIYKKYEEKLILEVKDFSEKL